MAIEVRHGDGSGIGSFGRGRRRAAALSAPMLTQRRAQQPVAPESLTIFGGAGGASGSIQALQPGSNLLIFGGAGAAGAAGGSIVPVAPREDLELALTTRQRLELERLADAEAQALASPDFSDEEKRELRRRFAARRAGIQPVERPREQTPAERFRQGTFTDQRTGRVYALNEQGLPDRAIYEPPEREPTWQDRLKMYELAMNYATGESGVDQARFREFMSMLGFPGAGGGLVSGEGATAAGAIDPQQPAAPTAGAAAARGPAQPTPSQLIQQITSAQPTKGVIDPGKVADLPTADYQLEVAMQAQAKLESEMESLREAADKARARYVGAEGGMAPTFVMQKYASAERRFELAKKRVQALQAKRAELISRREMLMGQQAAIEALRARQRGGR